MMHLDFVNMFREVVDEITKVHGESGSVCLTPVRNFGAEKVSAMWFIDGSNHGISLSDNGIHLVLRVWSHSGDVKHSDIKTTYNIGPNLLTVLTSMAQMVGLLPKDQP